MLNSCTEFQLILSDCTDSQYDSLRRCPDGYKELNSPYVACVPEDMNLAHIDCFKDSDCVAGQTCREWQCVATGGAGLPVAAGLV